MFFNLNKTKVNSKVFDKEVIAIHIRRGDYIDNPNYVLLPITYYYLALEQYFPNWRTQYNVLIFSDDIEYCKVHFEVYNNVYYDCTFVLIVLLLQCYVIQGPMAHIKQYISFTLSQN